MLISKLFYRHFLFTIMSTAIEIVAISFIVGRMLCCLWVFTQKVKSIELILTWNCKNLRQSGYKWYFCLRYSQEVFFSLLFCFVLFWFIFCLLKLQLSWCLMIFNLNIQHVPLVIPATLWFMSLPGSFNESRNLTRQLSWWRFKNKHENRDHW